MRLRKLTSQVKLKGKRVLVRIDANVPIVKGRVVDGPFGRIARSAVGIDWLSQQGAKVIVISHLGRPGGKKISAYSLKPVARRLSSLLRTKVKMSSAILGKSVDKLVNSMKDGDVLLLENIRFDSREKENSQTFAQQLSSLADLYVNDAFAVSHREHTSVSAIAERLPSYAGPLLVQEVSILKKLDRSNKPPFILIMGGLKIETKLPVIDRFAREAESILIGGALATTFLVAKGIFVGRSVFEESQVSTARSLLKKYGDKILLPSDVIVTTAMRRDARIKNVSIDSVVAKDRIVDIGKETIDRYSEKIEDAKTIVWNGPLGYCEIERFCNGTKEIAKAISKRTGKAVSIVGGGDTVPVLEKLHVADQFTLLSTGGSAMLEFLAGKEMPGLDPLYI